MKTFQRAHRKALRDVGAERFANNINEEITEKGSTLSTGERQLISFARALALTQLF